MTAKPIRIKLPVSNLPGVSKNASKQFMLLGAIVSVCLIVFLISVLDIHSIFSFATPHSSGTERIFICSSDPTHAQREVRFDSAATAIIAQDEYPYISLRDSFIENAELSQLAQISSLRGISLQNCIGFSSKGMGYLANSVYLEYLCLVQCRLSQSDLDALQSSNLQILDLSETHISNLDWTSITRIQNLRQIILRRVYITPKNRDVLVTAGYHWNDEDTLAR